MNFIKTQLEFDEMKKEFTRKIDSFLIDFNEFTRHVAPKYWRSGGIVYSELKKFKDHIQKFEPIQMKDLKQDWVRDEVMTDDERELWNTSKKYNV